jgi:hypothetical protein
MTYRATKSWRADRRSAFGDRPSAFDEIGVLGAPKAGRRAANAEL